VTERTPDLLSEHEHRPRPAIDRQQLGAQDHSDLSEQVLKFRDPPKRSGEFLMDVTEPLARLRASPQNRPESISVAVQDGRLFTDKQPKHLPSHVIAVHLFPLIEVSISFRKELKKSRLSASTWDPAQASAGGEGRFFLTAASL